MSFSEACRSASRSRRWPPSCRLRRPVFRRLHLRGSELRLRLLVVVPQLHQQLAFRYAVAFLDRQHLDAATENGRQLGSLTGLDGTGSRVGDRRFDLATVDLGQHDNDRFGPADPPDGSPDQGDGSEGEGSLRMSGLAFMGAMIPGGVPAKSAIGDIVAPAARCACDRSYTVARRRRSRRARNVKPSPSGTNSARPAARSASSQPARPGCNAS